MSIEFYIAGYNFPVNSIYTPNYDMEADSYWLGAGDQSSVWYSSTIQKYGNRSFAWNVTSGFVFDIKTLAHSETAWDSYSVRWGTNNAGMENVSSEGFLGRYDFVGTKYYNDINFAFRFNVNIPVTAVVAKAYLSVKCSAAASPYVYYPRIKQRHSNVAYNTYSDYIFVAGWYNNSVGIHNPVFSGGTWYYGEGQTYAYNLATDMQAVINSLSGVNTSQWINITISGADGADSRATFFQDRGLGGVTSDFATFQVTFITGVPASLGANYIRHTSPISALHPGSSYVLEGNVDLSVGDGKYLAKILTSDASSCIAVSSIQCALGAWSNFRTAVSVSAVTVAPLLQIEYVGSTNSFAYFDDVFIRDSRDMVSLGVVQIYPEWNMQRQRVVNAANNRTKGGKLYSYRWGDYDKFGIDLDYVSNSKAAIINSWWSTDALIYFKIYSEGVWEVNTCYLMNDNAPFAERMKPYTQYRTGKLELETF